MKKLFLLLVLCFCVTTILAKPLAENKIKTENVFSIEKASDLKIVPSFEFSSFDAGVVPVKKIGDYNKEAAFFKENFVDPYLVIHNYNYRERLNTKYILDKSGLISKLGLLTRESNCR
ncbi:hypothetical protein [Flavobacterium mekongense]|uniref:hypothetical protein n=1 Tax=Flavobacterium mekongense TaxID=3379707 RepID=UPI00399BE993